MISIFILSTVALALAGSNDHLWTSKGRAGPTERHPITIFIKDRDGFAASCPNLLDAVSNPDSPKYGQHYTFEQMAQFADEKAYNKVKSWAIRRFGAASVDCNVNMDLCSIDAAVADIERVFRVELHNYVHNEAAHITLRRPSSEFQAPAAIKDSIRTISAMGQLPYHRAEQGPMAIAQVATTTQANGIMSPQVIWSYYGVNNRTIADARASNMIFAALGQSFSPSDLQSFQQQNGIPQTPIAKVHGTNQPQACQFSPNSCIEASLDVQSITATAQSGNTQFWGIGQNVQDIFLDFMQQIARDPTPPTVASISYGSLGPEDPKNDMDQFNVELCKQGLRGLTLIVSSGDDGVANFQARNNPAACGFVPSFPATSPYATAVGATQGPEVGQTEIMCSSSTGGLITSGGGFSDNFPMPAYQTAKAKAYLKQLSKMGKLPPAGSFNKLGRGYPDVSVDGHNYAVTVGGQSYTVSGTSASAPVFAAMVSLINGRRVAAGKSTVGFLNPALYGIPSHIGAFRDITSGENNCAAGQANPTCCPNGFYAIQGWDATTGLGSPHFNTLANYLVSL